MHTQIALCSFVISSYKGFASFLVTNDLLDVSPLSRSGNVVTRIRSITEQLSLFPTSSARHPFSAPCGGTCL
jgi:hypothetical protein